MQFKIPHKFTKDEAKMRIVRTLEEARGNPEFKEKVVVEEERWDGYTFHYAFTAEGKSISGTVVVDEKEFDVYAKLPLMLRMFEGRIQSAINEQMEQLLK